MKTRKIEVNKTQWEIVPQEKLRCFHIYRESPSAWDGFSYAFMAVSVEEAFRYIKRASYVFSA